MARSGRSTVSRYSALDQYAMGLRAPSEAPPMFLVTRLTSGQSAAAAPRIGVDNLGVRKDVTIDNIIAGNGARRPDSASAPKTFREAFIYLVSGTPETSDDLQTLEAIRSAWELLQRLDRSPRHDDRASALTARRPNRRTT
jgi:hypothetical protein